MKVYGLVKKIDIMKLANIIRFLLGNFASTQFFRFFSTSL